jgi:hypothetical protein
MRTEVSELSRFDYFRSVLTKVTTLMVNIWNIEDLTKIKGFSVDKANIIDLYLGF